MAVPQRLAPREDLRRGRAMRLLRLRWHRSNRQQLARERRAPGLPLNPRSAIETRGDGPDRWLLLCEVLKESLFGRLARLLGRHVDDGGLGLSGEEEDHKSESHDIRSLAGSQRSFGLANAPRGCRRETMAGGPATTRRDSANAQRGRNKQALERVRETASAVTGDQGSPSSGFPSAQPGKRRPRELAPKAPRRAALRSLAQQCAPGRADLMGCVARGEPLARGGDGRRQRRLQAGGGFPHEEYS